MSSYHVERQDYSAGAWRVLHAETGDQVWQDQILDHPVMGHVRVSGPVCFERKRDAVAWIAAHNA